MPDSILCKRCKINTNYDGDRFVGIRCVDGDISITFPIGFNLGNDEKQVRKDILLLIDVLKKNTDNKKSEITTNKDIDISDFPLQAYLSIIADYYNRGYFHETESFFTKAKDGKINWNRTVKQTKAYIQDNNIYFLDFITHKKNLQKDEIITQIHKYCVHESFLKIGWLFTNYVPENSKLKFNKKLFKSTVRKKISETFNERNRQLFVNMLEVIEAMGDSGSTVNYKYGTTRFEYVWEKMIDRAFGIADKQRYFPKTSWNIGGVKYKNTSLEPDTIMLVDDRIYVLDAKYYKYGITGKISDLPESTSINKQITYGEYIAENSKFKLNYGSRPIVYNAFLMPYNAKNNLFGIENVIYCAGSAVGDWKANDGMRSYEEIRGILIDINWLMNNYRSRDNKIYELAVCIEERL